MATSTITISLPQSLRIWVENRAECGYGSVSEYIRELIRRDQNLIRRDAQAEQQKYESRYSPSSYDSRFWPEGIIVSVCPDSEPELRALRCV